MPRRPTTAGSSTCPTSRSRSPATTPRLHQVVANLLANARTHTPAGTRVVTSVTPEGSWIRVSVADNGPGVPKSLQRNVFQRFTRGDDSRNRAAGSHRPRAEHRRRRREVARWQASSYQHARATPPSPSCSPPDP